MNASRGLRNHIYVIAAALSKPVLNTHVWGVLAHFFLSEGPGMNIFEVIYLRVLRLVLHFSLNTHIPSKLAREATS